MIKTWQERCEIHPDHQTGMITYQMIQNRMQEEIDDLRDALEKTLTDAEIIALWNAMVDRQLLRKANEK